MLVRWPRSICDYENAVKRVFLIWWSPTSLIGSEKLTCRPVYHELSLLQRLLLICLTLPVYVTVIYRLSVCSPLSILRSFSLNFLRIVDPLPRYLKHYQECFIWIIYWTRWSWLQGGYPSLISSPFLEIKCEQFLLTRCNVDPCFRNFLIFS